MRIYLSGVTRRALANSLLGCPWADPLAALVIAADAVKGHSAWRAASCRAPNASALSGAHPRGPRRSCGTRRRGLDCTGRCRPGAQTVKRMVVTATANTAHFKPVWFWRYGGNAPGVQKCDREMGSVEVLDVRRFEDR